MKRVKLTQQRDLELFKVHFEQRAGNHVSTEYLQASDVYAYRHRQDLIAGYVIHSDFQHRFFDLMSQIGFDNIQSLPGMQNEFSEITCMWINPAARSFSLRLRFYSYCMLNTFAKRRRYIIGGTKIAAVSRMQQYCLPYILFHGETDNSIGNGNWIIYYGTPWTFLKGFASLLVIEGMKAAGFGQEKNSVKTA